MIPFLILGIILVMVATLKFHFSAWNGVLSQ
jgi:hypothetical protein